MKFMLEMELGNDAMQYYTNIREAIYDHLRLVKLENHTKNPRKPSEGDGGTICDSNGNMVGKWEVTEREEVHQGTILPDGSLVTLIFAPSDLVDAAASESLELSEEDARILLAEHSQKFIDSFLNNDWQCILGTTVSMLVDVEEV
jgi:hypothetical protein